MSDVLLHSQPTNNGCIGFFYDDPEILPQNVQGRFYFDQHGQRLDELDRLRKARAVLEGQCLSKRLYLQRANVDLVNSVDRVVITGRLTLIEQYKQTSPVCPGGASVNVDLLQILADIFAKPVYAAVAPNSGALGGALRAVDVLTGTSNGNSSSTVECLVAAQPRQEYAALYDAMLDRYAQLESKLV